MPSGETAIGNVAHKSNLWKHTCLGLRYLISEKDCMVQVSCVNCITTVHFSTHLEMVITYNYMFVRRFTESVVDNDSLLKHRLLQFVFLFKGLYVVE